MTSDPDRGGGWIQLWITAQRAAVESLSGGGISGVSAAGEMTELLRKLATGQAAGTGGPADQLAAMWKAFGFPPAFGVAPGADDAGIGPLREVQGAVAGLAAAMADHQRLTAELSAVMAKVHMDTLDLLARRTAEQANSGAPIATFKLLYDLWIECGEATYARVVEGDAYCRLQSELTNTGIRIRGLEQHLVERWLKQLDLPTRSELNTLHRRLRDVQQELLALKADQAPTARKPVRGKTPSAGKSPAGPARKAAKPGKGG